MRELIIHRLYFTEADCYRKDVRQTPRGVQVHSTGANNPFLRRYVQPDDGLLGKNVNGNSHNRPGVTVCANAYIGKQRDGAVAVYQTLPWDCRCWLSGSGPRGNANKMGYIGFEICEDGLTDAAYFHAAMELSVLLTAHLCAAFGFRPRDVVAALPSGNALAVMDHAALHRAGIASNHGDIGHWLKRFGLSLEDYRDQVCDAMREGVTVNYIDKEEIMMEGHPTLRQGDSGEAVRSLQTLLRDAGAFVAVDGRFGPETANAVRAFQRLCSLEADGIVGPKTWAALEGASAKEKESVHPPDNFGEETSPAETVTMTRADFDALKAAWAAMGELIQKYDAVG